MGGTLITDQLDERGEAVLRDVPPGSCHVKMLDHKGIEFDA